MIEAQTLSRRAAEEIGWLRDEPEWLVRRRLDAWRTYEETPFPTGFEEEWRRTPISDIVVEGVAPLAPGRPAVAHPGDLPEGVRELWDEKAAAGGLVLQHDSDTVHVHLAADAAARGVIFTDLHTAAREHADLFQRYVGRAVPADEWKYTALNQALWSGGVFLYVPPDIEVELPLSYALAHTAEGVASFPRTLVIADRGAKVTFIQESLSPTLGSTGFANGVTEVFAGEGAQLTVVDVQRWGGNVKNFSTLRAVLEPQAAFTGIILGIGGLLTKSRFDISMPQPGSRGELLGLMLGSERQHFDYNTLQDHVGHHTASDLLFKAALQDEASLAWYGVVKVHKNASASEASQTSRNLLMSDRAKAAPIPVLEIEAYAVLRCSHAAAAGPVDEDQLFYLQARGIPPAEAEQMLVQGFFQDVLDRVPSEQLREKVGAVLGQKLGLVQS